MIEFDSEKPLVKDAPTSCCLCGKALCLRKQVINLALGNVEEMKCLACLGKEGGKAPDQVLADIKEYVHSRDCFLKEWRKYVDVSYCPDPDHCFPDICFGCLTSQ